MINSPVPKSMTFSIGIDDIMEVSKEIENYDELNDGLNDPFWKKYSLIQM